MKEKVDPYMQPLYDALNDFFPPKQVAKLIEEKQIEIAPLAFMRGRTLANAYVVLDEAQNATTMQMKMFLTRLGEGSRMAVTGDVTQIDLPRGVTSGLVEAERLLRDVPGVGFARFTAEDVVRHPLVARIIRAYESAQPEPMPERAWSRRWSRTRAGRRRRSRRWPSGRRGRRWRPRARPGAARDRAAALRRRADRRAERRVPRQGGGRPTC